MEQMKISRVWVDATHVYAETINGIRASYAFSDWPRLANATEEERQDFHLSYSGIHWPQIDEDLSFEGMFVDNHLCERSPKEELICYPPAKQALSELPPLPDPPECLKDLDYSGY